MHKLPRQNAEASSSSKNDSEGSYSEDGRAQGGTEILEKAVSKKSKSTKMSSGTDGASKKGNSPKPLIPWKKKSEKVFLNTKFIMRSEKVGSGTIENVQVSTHSSLNMNDESFAVEYLEECPRPGKEYSLMLQKRDDLYEAKCYKKEHKNYFGFKLDTREFVILSVIKSGDQAVCYETSAKGCAEVTTTINASNSKFDKLIELAYESVKITDPAFEDALYSIEKKHKFGFDALNVSVLYSVDNEIDPHAMMNLDCTSHSPAYAEFLSLFGVDLSNLKFAQPQSQRKIDNTPDDATCTAATCTPSEAEDSTSASMLNRSNGAVCDGADDEFSPRLTCTPFDTIDVFKTANGNTIAVTLHIATLLRSHFQRQFIGNSIPIVIFRELKQKKEFQPLAIHKMKTLGLFPQFFIVVEPHGLNQYKLSFFKKKTLKFFFPLVHNIIIDKSQLREVLYTKIYNGLFATMTCAPLDLMLQTTPRNVTIQGLAKEFAPKFYDEYKGFVQKVDPTSGGLVQQSRIRVTNVSIGGSSQSSGSGVHAHSSKPAGKSSQVTSSGGTTAS